jgi:UDP-N-acetylglucosamine 1-carboxyvinyltransferase
MLAAVTAKGTTTIENAAKEPHIVDLANFLNAMGANITGTGTDVIKIKGVKKLTGGHTYSTIPDQIEAGTYMIAAAVTEGDITVTNVIPKHMESLSRKLMEIGMEVIEGEDSIRVIGKPLVLTTNIKTLPYPGFPTDLHPQITVLLGKAKGTSRVREEIWEERFQYADQLRKMGANIMTEAKMAFIQGPWRLLGAPVKATDLRAGITMVLAGLTAEGTTTISNIEYIDRGYEDLIGKLTGVGANIKRINTNGKSC